jgi:hypothetical protein
MQAIAAQWWFLAPALALLPGVNYPELLATTIVSGAVGR